jgi:L-amino acid N-acyltransferase YncA
VTEQAGATIRLATIADAGRIREIYTHEVLTSTATFDLIPRTAEEQEAWIAERSGAFAAIVAIDAAGGDVLGFGSLSPYKERAAYRTSVDDSVYVDRACHGRGIGKLIVTELLRVAELSGFHTVFARIEAGGVASRALHAACGFELVGVEREVGRKFHRWLDVAIMQRLL